MFLKSFNFAALLILVSFASTSVQAAKPTMAVLDFQNSTGAAWWYGGVGSDLAGMLTNELASSKSFSMIERQKLASVLGEQNLAKSGRVTPSSGAKWGKMVGANYLVTATVSSYEHNTQKTGGGLSYKGVSLGGKKNQAYIAVDLRVIDSTTGVIADSRTVEARSGGLGLNVGLYRGGFGGRLANEKKTPAGKAIRAVVVEIADYLECSLVKKNSCMNDFDKKEKKRRDGLKSGIKLD